MILQVAANTVVVVTRDLLVAQTIAPIVSTSAEEGSAAASVGETFVVHPTLEVATTQDVIRTSVSETPIVTSEMRQLLTQLAFVFLGGTSVPPLTSESTFVTIVETGSGSAPQALTPTIDILEELTLQMIDQFFTTIKYCTELVLTRVSSFEFT